MTNRELFWRRATFGICVGVSIVSGFWAYVLYRATIAIYSDLTPYGIEYGGEAYDEIVAITKRHVWGVCSPFIVVLAMSLIAWGMQIWRDGRALRADFATSAREAD